MFNSPSSFRPPALHEAVWNMFLFSNKEFSSQTLSTMSMALLSSSTPQPLEYFYGRRNSLQNCFQVFSSVAEARASINRFFLSCGAFATW